MFLLETFSRLLSKLPPIIFVNKTNIIYSKRDKGTRITLYMSLKNPIKSVINMPSRTWRCQTHRHMNCSFDPNSFQNVVPTVCNPKINKQIYETNDYSMLMIIFSIFIVLLRIHDILVDWQKKQLLTHHLRLKVFPNPYGGQVPYVRRFPTSA